MFLLEALCDPLGIARTITNCAKHNTNFDFVLQIWSKVIPLQFIRREYGLVDIEVKFVTGHHGDNTPFDGSGQTLAHAYFPLYGGNAHFDDDERWTVNVPEGLIQQKNSYLINEI